ncbi:lysM and putative peptidoglycan-binding domain-containing protein 3-like [Saccoglossus kowalevskii]|uniref:LysM and putative peptidoglycan-binding domain-containing protein 3-like n=1 Tax=Saccoglossus kowalevskii TaxID=10224 RepID=A0ABM0GIY4_SACKO|nr:PREDICTED: lysM and putative peptidoglycan-binding domain-containing protein 3-like [Saccoglossus kowalevskii]
MNSSVAGRPLRHGSRMPSVHGSSSSSARKKKNHRINHNKYLSNSGQVQNVQNARVYIFGDADVEAGEINGTEVEMSQIRPRGAKKKRSATNTFHDVEPEEPLYIERKIEDEDTLQSFALQYGVPVSELKRINNLIIEQDFFRLKTIKVPVKKYGLLTELHEEKRRRPNAAQPTEAKQTIEVNDEDDEDTVFEVRTVSIRDSLQGNSEASEFLKNMDKDLEKIRKSTRTEKSSLTEVTSMLNARYIQPLTPPKPKFDGANCGFSWWTMVIIMFAIGIITPVFYFLFKDHIHNIQP